MPGLTDRRARGGHVAALALFAAISVAMTWPLIRQANDHVPSDPYDPLYTVWLLDRNAHAAEQGSAEFGQANIFYPQRNTLYYGDAVPLLSLLAWPVGRLTGNFVLAYNAVFILSFFLCAWGLYALAYRLARSKPAAFLAGLMFAFCAYRFGHLAHLELLHFAWIPFCFLFLHRFFESLSLRDLVPAALFYLLQVLSCAYYGQYLAVFIVLFVLFFLIQKKLWKEPRFWLKAVPVLFVTAAILVWYFLPYLRVHQAMGFTRPLWEVEAFSAQLQHFLSVPPEALLWGRLLGDWGGPETRLFPGAAASLLTAFWWFTRPRHQLSVVHKKRPIFLAWDIIHGVWLAALLAVVISGGFSYTLIGVKISAHRTARPFLALLISLALRLFLDGRTRAKLRTAFASRKPEEWFYLLLLALAWLLSLGPQVRLAGRVLFPGPYGVLYKWAPGFKALRVPARFAVLVLLALALFSAMAVHRLLQRLRRPMFRAAAVAGLSFLVLAEAAMLPLPLVPVGSSRDVPAVYRAVRDLPENSALVEWPMPASDAEEFREALPMFYSMFHRKNIVNGYSGYAPPGYRIVREAMEGFPSPEVFNLLRDLEVSHVLIHDRNDRPDKRIAALASLEKDRSEAEVVFEGEGGVLLKIRTVERPAEESRVSVPVGRRQLWKAVSNRNPREAALAFDGRAATAWTTGYPQFPGDIFELDLGEEMDVEGLEMDLDGAPYDYPRGFVLEGSSDGRSWRKLDARPAFWPPITRRTAEDFSSYRVSPLFERTRIRRLRVVLTSNSPHHWTISELRPVIRALRTRQIPSSSEPAVAAPGPPGDGPFPPQRSRPPSTGRPPRP